MTTVLKLFNVCALMITGSLYHPRLLSDEVETEEVQNRIKEHEYQYLQQVERLQREMEEKQNNQRNIKIHLPAHKEESPKMKWNTRIVPLLVTIHFLALWIRDNLSLNLQNNNTEEEEEEKQNEVPQRTYDNILNTPDQSVLDQFYNVCIQNGSQEPVETCEFAECFVDSLLEAGRNICPWSSAVTLEDCVGIGSQFENWGCKTPSVYDILVPILLKDGYCFKPEICSCDNPPEKQIYGRILMVTPHTADLTCQCKAAGPEGDIPCLIHSKKIEPDVHSNGLASIMYSEWYLDYKKIVKWFRILLCKSWNIICHQHDFEITFRNITGCCGLKVQYQSGRTIHIKVFPAVRLKGSDVHLVSHFSDHPKNSPVPTTYWHISCAVCEYRFLKIMMKNIPKSSCHLKCLQILVVLTEKMCSSPDQRCVLGSYLFKTVLMHLLLSQPYSNWHERHLEHRLRDVLKYLGKCLDEKRIHKFIIGNQNLPKQIGIPELLLKTAPVNLFQSFVTEHDSYCQALMEYQKILRDMGPLMMECIKNNTAAE
ncbi:inositol 1,4,5-trisphosphate receptor-interacting protein-like [Rhinoraja longicauda]